MRLLCPFCRKEYTIGKQELLKVVPDFPLEDGQESVQLYKAVGCLSCNSTGYRGRIGVYEFLRVTDNMQKLIINEASINELRTLAIKEGMTTLRDDGLNKVKQGLSTLEEMLRVII